MELLIITDQKTLRHSTGFYKSRDMHQADIVFIHQPGSGFYGTFMKYRPYRKLKKKVEGLISIDAVLSNFNYLPRKKKKQIKTQLSKVITNYKKNY